MVINSITFLLFFIVVFAIYYANAKRNPYQNGILLISNLSFYGFTNRQMLLLIIISIIIQHIIGNLLYKQIIKGNNKAIKLYTSLGIIIGVSILFYFKYLNFFIESMVLFLKSIGLNVNYHTFKIIMPVGISFFTFRLISYIVDIYQRNIKPVSLLNFATYISFFPCILSGPIDRSQTFLPQIAIPRKFDYNLSIEGCRQILWGMFKKMVIADPLSNFTASGIEGKPGSILLIMAISYSIQLYADFSGYSDMAIGTGKILGIRITKNFHYPYFSRNVAEFWNRWHISLLSWFRYYIYFPLGGSRCSTIFVIRNTFIIFLISGLWHGANWTFILWGIYHALLFIPSLLNKKRKRYKEQTPYQINDLSKILSTFILITLGWIIFQNQDISDTWLHISTILSPSLFTRPSGISSIYSPIIFSALMFFIEWQKRKEEFPLQNLQLSKITRWSIYIALVLTIIYFQGKPAEFIYFKF